MKQTQPKVKKGTTFNGWAISNWGLLLPWVYRTRKQAMAAAIERRGINESQHTWKEASKNHRLVKVKVTVL